MPLYCVTELHEDTAAVSSEALIRPIHFLPAVGGQSTKEISMATTIAVHGNAISFAESPSQCEQVDGVAWSDIVGLRRGWGTTFRGRAGQFVWFHYALPALS